MKKTILALLAASSLNLHAQSNQAIEQAIETSPDLKIRTLLAALDVDVQYHYVQLYLTWRQRQ